MEGEGRRKLEEAKKEDGERKVGEGRWRKEGEGRKVKEGR